MKKWMALFLTMALATACLTGCGKKEPAQTSAVRVGALSGPTAMGMVSLMNESENGRTENTYEFAELSTDPAAFVTPLMTGELDIAAVPSNLAAVLYQNSEGKIRVLAETVNCVLAIVERGETVASLEDLKGKKIYATGQGAVPEYTLTCLLGRSGIDIDSDVTVQWCADTTEALSYVSEDSEAIAMLPQPFVTVALSKVESLRVALDLNEVWTRLVPECTQITGVLVARADFVDNNPKTTETFLSDYEASAKVAMESPEEAATLIEKYGIVPKAALAQKALPGCHITFVTGDAMKQDLMGFYEVLYSQNPKAIGGAMPEDNFFYNAK